MRLAPPRPENLETFVVPVVADPEVTRYLSRRYPPSPKQEEDWLEGMASSGEDVAWAISLKETGALIGVTGLHRIDWRHRHGWDSRSPSAIARRGVTATRPRRSASGRRMPSRSTLGFEKVLASVYGCNAASVRLLAQVGYRECGVLRRNAFFAGQWHDEWLAEILREEWKGRQVSMPPRTACRPPTD